MKYIVYIFLLFPILVTAQTYKYIGIENGLSNRRIFNIQKDDQGYTSVGYMLLRRQVYG